MNFEGQFSLPGTPDEVMARLSDVERVARCVPGAELEGRDPEDGAYTGSMVVAFGPKRIRFRGKVFCEFDHVAHTGFLRGRGVADMRAARFEVRTRFTVTPAPEPLSGQEAAASLVRLSSEVDMTGVLASLASTGGAVVANVLMAEFARNLIAEYGDAPGETQDNDARAENPLRVSRVLWSAVRDQAARILPGKREG